MLFQLTVDSSTSESRPCGRWLDVYRVQEQGLTLGVGKADCEVVCDEIDVEVFAAT
jgi:hypothetical protein